MTYPAEGGCRCGALRFRLKAAPMVSIACHCTGCQRMSSSPFSVSLRMKAEDFEVIRGEHVVGGMKGPRVHHQHCPECHSWVFSTFAAPHVNVRAVMLDDTSGIAPLAEIWTDEKLPWAGTGARRSFPQFPTDDQRAALADEYAEFLTSREI